MPADAAQRATSLADIRDRLEHIDLIASQQPLLEGIADRFAALEGVGIDSAAELLARLKSKDAIETVASESGVDAAYLNLLRRAVNGFFPKPRRWKEFESLDAAEVAALADAGIKNTRQLFDAASDDRPALAKRAKLAEPRLSELVAAADLTRIQWVSPAYASALVAAGYTTPAAVAAADPEALGVTIEDANAGARFYRGKVGLRDLRRLVEAARYVT